MNIVEELRNKKSRDNRELLDHAADRIEELETSHYRKASDVAEDIIRMLRAGGIDEWRYPIVADIKKKYTEGGAKMDGERKEE